ncbi:MAG: cell wall hydrolase [Lachnospiraceae bacterium]|nr:cell wall hydrolase [Lachnospiraceae bacterium]
MVIIMAMALSVAVIPSNTSFSDDNKIEELQKKIDKAKEAKKEAQNQFDDNKEELDTLTETATTLKGTLNDLNSELVNVCNNIADIEEKIRIKNDEIETLKADLTEALIIESEQYKAMKVRIQYMYEKQNNSFINIFFGSDSYSETLNKNEYFESLTAYDRKMLNQYRETRKVIQEAKALVEEEYLELEELQNEAIIEQNRVTGLVERTSNSIADYESEIEQTEQEMAEQEAKIKEQEANINALQKELEEEKRLSKLASKSAWRNISQVTFAEGDRYLLANIIYCEAGNQPYEGQVAVGAVVINRVLSSVFPDTVVGVIYQKNQFSPVKSGRLALALSRGDATEACYRAADEAMAGHTTVGNCLFFRRPVPGINGTIIGDHVFY